MVAGQAEGINVWNLSEEFRETVPCDTFLPTTTEDGRVGFYSLLLFMILFDLYFIILLLA